MPAGVVRLFAKFNSVLFMAFIMKFFTGKMGAGFSQKRYILWTLKTRIRYPFMRSETAKISALKI